MRSGGIVIAGRGNHGDAFLQSFLDGVVYGKRVGWKAQLRLITIGTLLALAY